MHQGQNHSLIPLARDLRKNMTPEERHLWYDYLRQYPVRFRRQQIFLRYILDFYCDEAKLAIELDGSQHYEEDAMAGDSQRTAFLEQYGIHVLRFSNIDINQHFEGVCQVIDRTVCELTGRERKE